MADITLKYRNCGISREALENVEYSFNTITPGSLWPRIIVPIRVPIMSTIEQFNHLLYCKTM